MSAGGAGMQAQAGILAQSAIQPQPLPDAPSALLLSQAAALQESAHESSPQDQQGQPTAAPPVSAKAAAAAQTAPQTAPQTTDPVMARKPAGTATAPQSPAQAAAQAAANQAASASLPRCPHEGLDGTILFLPGKYYGPCQEQNQLQFIIDTGPVHPLTPSQKGLLAIRGVLDPFNLITIAGFSAITVATNSHTAYGPGFAGFGRLAGYSLVGDIQGEFIGTYAIPVLTHEDPRYHRLPGRAFSVRLMHAVVHTYVTQHDNGSLMPNYSTLLGYPIGAEISNLYVPGLQTNAPATAERVAVALGTDPVGALIAEFLPDVARRIHIHVIFMQQILNQVATGSSSTPP